MPDFPLILLVDGDAAPRFLTQRLLRPYADRARVLEANSGQEALHELNNQVPGPTLVLLDLNMLLMNGLYFFEVCALHLAAGAAHGHQSRTGVLDREGEPQQAAALGVDFGPKPLTTRSLSTVLEQQMGEIFVSQVALAGLFRILFLLFFLVLDNPFAAILLVDDDVSTTFLTEVSLYPLRLTDTYWTAHNGTDAFAQLQQHQERFLAAQPLLVLLDMALPVLNGMGFLVAFGELRACSSSWR